MIAQGEQHGIAEALESHEDLRSLKQILIYGLKGVAAYADHAAILGREDESVYEFVQRAWPRAWTSWDWKSSSACAWSAAR